jgi:hypothetical protein
MSYVRPARAIKFERIPEDGQKEISKPQ